MKKKFLSEYMFCGAHHSVGHPPVQKTKKGVEMTRNPVFRASLSTIVDEILELFSGGRVLFTSFELAGSIPSTTQRLPA